MLHLNTPCTFTIVGKTAVESAHGHRGTGPEDRSPLMVLVHWESAASLRRRPEDGSPQIPRLQCCQPSLPSRGWIPTERLRPPSRW